MDYFTDELESLDVSEPPYITIKRLIDVFKKYQPEPSNTNSCKPPGISTKDNENVVPCEEKTSEKTDDPISNVPTKTDEDQRISEESTSIAGPDDPVSNHGLLVEVPKCHGSRLIKGLRSFPNLPLGSRA
ncbi:hypothetical protein OUZ56_012545 [Daphnia magna]|uniref:Uncharacterized protein n=1 Tax=Daphnia magna TaxID=35525 RepID=A0ABQ9Z3C3_9CRUS|nr:hypothetical protein OUZ56_012545 [Daphnia magna]